MAFNISCIQSNIVLELKISHVLRKDVPRRKIMHFWLKLTWNSKMTYIYYFESLNRYNTSRFENDEEHFVFKSAQFLCVLMFDEDYLW